MIANTDHEDPSNMGSFDEFQKNHVYQTSSLKPTGQGRIQIFWKGVWVGGGALCWPLLLATKKWSKKAKITLETIRF